MDGTTSQPQPIIDGPTNPPPGSEPFFLFCSEWEPLNNYLFQIANSLIVISLLALFTRPSLFWHLFERLFLTAGCFAFSLWAWLYVCAPDITVWNLIFALLHAYYLTILWFHIRPYRYFDPVEEDLRRALFRNAPLVAYEQLIRMSSGTLRVKKGMRIQIASGYGNLSLVMDGNIQAIAFNRVVYTATTYQFTDSIHRSANIVFPVTLVAAEDTTLLVWESGALFRISQDRELSHLMSAAVADDVAGKLKQYLEAYAAMPSNSTDSSESERL